jgi:hypothetical protein
MRDWDRDAAARQGCAMHRCTGAWVYLLCLVVTLCLPWSMLHAIQLETPKSVIDLLVNMKLAAQSGLLEQDEFYTEESLKKAFGANTVQFGSQPCPEISASTYRSSRHGFRELRLQEHR